MCSTPELAGKLVAVYKVSQSVGAAIAYQLTTDNLNGRKQFISNWCIIAITLVVARTCLAANSLDEGSTDIGVQCLQS
jgi:hypothetical protein